MKRPLIGKITSSFGKRVNPITKKEEFHGGIDIKPITEDLTVIFPYSGKIVAIGESLGGFGNRTWVKINKVGHILHGRYYILAHMESLNEGLYNGKTVLEGETAGICGSTGMSTGVHLHFEVAKSVLVSRVPIEPAEIIKAYEKPAVIEETLVFEQVDIPEKEKEIEPIESEKIKELKKEKEAVKEKIVKKSTKENGNNSN